MGVTADLQETGARGQPANDAVLLEVVGDCIVKLTLNDRVNKNTFSSELSIGLMQAFAHIRANDAYKAVIMTGYDTYFCSGGTQQGLVALNDGKMRFTDNAVFSLPLTCPVPVIAAMQGHGIGGGFIFGLFADYVILARESIYNVNCMRYGFTPGFGSTLVLPERLGLPLATEILTTGRNYRGAELQQRGISFPVVARALVLEQALALARNLAEKPRISLVLLKQRLNARLNRELAEAVDAELRMHETTFHLPEVRRKIDEEFGS
ncbi:polyketide synthase [Tahibacter sp.]|uniref:polyketide synthase n=1 Tax=Tahibacter sp. TaxID=2056211 RepID=UPI0028C3B433|nr:polyketide synthase [Tahibacter sp.]